MTSRIIVVSMPGSVCVTNAGSTWPIIHYDYKVNILQDSSLSCTQVKEWKPVFERRLKTHFFLRALKKKEKRNLPFKFDRVHGPWETWGYIFYTSVLHFHHLHACNSVRLKISTGAKTYPANAIWRARTWSETSACSGSLLKSVQPIKGECRRPKVYIYT